MKVGILGGTFDPIHLGHIAAARACIAALGLDRVLLVPTGVPSHRPIASASAEHRWHMVVAACEGDAALEPSRIDIDRHTPTYSIDTVRDVRSKFPDAQLYLIVGEDAYAGFETWREPDALRAEVTLVVVERSSSPDDASAASKSAADVLHVSLAGYDISATQVRARVARGEPISSMVAPAVAQYIEQHALYR